MLQLQNDRTAQGAMGRQRKGNIVLMSPAVFLARRPSLPTPGPRPG